MRTPVIAVINGIAELQRFNASNEVRATVHILTWEINNRHANDINNPFGKIFFIHLRRERL